MRRFHTLSTHSARALQAFSKNAFQAHRISSIAIIGLVSYFTVDASSKEQSGREFTSFIEDDVEHCRSEELLCLSERFMAYRPLFPAGTEFSFDAASNRICVVTDRYSSRSGSIVMIKPLHHEALDILADGILPDCDKCNKDSSGECDTVAT